MQYSDMPGEWPKAFDSWEVGLPILATEFWSPWSTLLSVLKIKL